MQISIGYVASLFFASNFNYLFNDTIYRIDDSNQYLNSQKINPYAWGSDYPGLFSINYLPSRKYVYSIGGMSQYCKFYDGYNCTLWSADVMNGTFSILGWNFKNT